MTGSVRQVKPGAGIDFVYFDVGGTLLDPYPSVGGVYRRAGLPFGLEASEDEIERAFRVVWRNRTEHTPFDPNTGLHAQGRADADRTTAWWRALVYEVFQKLGWQPPQRTQSACFQAFFEAFERPESWRVYPDVLPTLDALAARGIGAGILSNWDYRLPALLSALSLAHRFSWTLISAFEGLAKPDPAFFELALARVGLPANRVAYVGDRESLDLLPALALGMDAYLIDRPGRGDRTLRAPEHAGRIITSLSTVIP